jgi:methionyl-tRNA formyltransferase
MPVTCTFGVPVFWALSTAKVKLWCDSKRRLAGCQASLLLCEPKAFSCYNADVTRIVFMGSPDFALPSLRALAQHFEVVGVVTQPDRPAGRGKRLAAPPVKTLAIELGIQVIQPNRLKEPQALAQLQSWAPDVIVVAAFGQILRKAVLELPPHGCINVHASLLPRWRGASPIQAAILHGDAEAGVTIMKMDAGLDTGPMLSKRGIPIQPDDTAATLSDKLAQLGAGLLVETLPRYLSGDLQPQPQPNEGVTEVSMLEKAEGELDFTATAAELERKVRAFNPWPGAYMMWNGQPLKVHRAHLASGRGQPGQRKVVDGSPAVFTADGVLVLDEVQPAGKKPMPGNVFLLGARAWAR